MRDDKGPEGCYDACMVETPMVKESEAAGVEASAVFLYRTREIVAEVRFPDGKFKVQKVRERTIVGGVAPAGWPRFEVKLRITANGSIEVPFEATLVNVRIVGPGMMAFEYDAWFPWPAASIEEAFGQVEMAEKAMRDSLTRKQNRVVGPGGV